MTETEQLATIDSLHRKSNDTRLHAPGCAGCGHAWPCRTRMVLLGLPPKLSPAIQSLRNVAEEADRLLSELREACEDKTVRPEHALISSIQLAAKNYQDTALEHLEHLLAQMLRTDFPLTTAAWHQPEDPDAASRIRLLDPAATATLAAVADLHQQRQGWRGKHDLTCADCGRAWPCDSYCAAIDLPQGSGKAVRLLHGFAGRLSQMIKDTAYVSKELPTVLDHLSFVLTQLADGGTSEGAADLLGRLLTPVVAPATEGDRS